MSQFQNHIVRTEVLAEESVNRRLPPGTYVVTSCVFASTEIGTPAAVVVNGKFLARQGEAFAHTVPEIIAKLKQGERYYFEGHPVAAHDDGTLVYDAGATTLLIPFPYEGAATSVRLAQTDPIDPSGFHGSAPRRAAARGAANPCGRERDPRRSRTASGTAQRRPLRAAARRRGERPSGAEVQSSRCFALPQALFVPRLRYGSGQAHLVPGKRYGNGGFLSADNLRKCQSGELPDSLRTQHELASRFLHHGTIAQGG